jgi:hypothetical protein
MPIDIGILYQILRNVAASALTIHYSDLSERYRERTGEWYEPHGSWDQALWQINALANQHEPRLPPLSAVVTLKPRPGEQEEPGGLFWGSSPDVPTKPHGKDARILRWAGILRSVHSAAWPHNLDSDSQRGDPH